MMSRRRLLFLAVCFAVLAIALGFVCRVDVTETRNGVVTRQQSHYTLIFLDNSRTVQPWSQPPSAWFPIHVNRLKVERAWAWGWGHDEIEYLDFFLPSIGAGS